MKMRDTLSTSAGWIDALIGDLEQYSTDPSHKLALRSHATLILLWTPVVLAVAVHCYSYGILLKDHPPHLGYSYYWAAAYWYSWALLTPRVIGATTLWQRAGRSNPRALCQLFLSATAIALLAIAVSSVAALLLMFLVQSITWAEVQGLIIAKLFRELPIGWACFAALATLWSSRDWLTRQATRRAPPSTQVTAHDPLWVYTGTGKARIKVNEIDYVNAARNYLEIHSQRRVYLLRRTLKSFARQLEGAGMARIHRSTLVNLERIKEVRNLAGGEAEAHLEDGAVLRVSKRYRSTLTQSATVPPVPQGQ